MTIRSKTMGITIGIKGFQLLNHTKPLFYLKSLLFHQSEVNFLLERLGF